MIFEQIDIERLIGEVKVVTPAEVAGRGRGESMKSKDALGFPAKFFHNMIEQKQGKDNGRTKEVENI